MRQALEPGLLRVFRYFTGVAAIYFAILWGYIAIASGWLWTAHAQLLTNFASNLALFGYLSCAWLERRLKQWYLPVGLGVATLIPVVSNFLHLAEPYQVSADLMIVRSWLLLPTLVVPLVLIAWQYHFGHVLAFTLFTNAVELITLFLIVRKINLETLPILAMPMIQGFAFGTVGSIVGRLMDTQRAQKRKLIQANIRLGQYTDTLEQLAVSRERNRLARELHDTLAHTLSGLAVNLEGIKTIIPPEQIDILKLVDRSLSTARLGLDETRRALKDLRAQPLEDLGLALALRNLAGSAAERSDLHIAVEIPARLPALPVDVEQCFYRVAQEALENIVLHAQAGRAGLEISLSGRQIVLTISDDGQGFDPDGELEVDRYGLQGMKERAAMIGGDLTIESRREHGTTIRLTWERVDDQGLDL